MRVKGFAQEADGSLYNEFYGNVTAPMARFIVAFSITPAEFDLLESGNGSKFFSSDTLAAYKRAK